MSVVTETVWIHVVPGIGACVSITIIIVNLVYPKSDTESLQFVCWGLGIVSLF